MRVCRHIADAIAAGLNGVHFHAGQIGQDIRGILQFRPIELNVLAGGEVTIALVILFGQMLPDVLPFGWHVRIQFKRMPMDFVVYIACL